MQPVPNPSAQKTALIVEDEPSTLRFYMTGLRGLQEFRLLPAENGRRAMELLRETHVDVVLTDLNMPVMDGYELISVLAQRYPALPVVVVTSVADAEQHDHALHLGALTVIPKPPRLSAVMETLREAVAVPPQGIMRGIGLASILQLMNWERRSATLTVRSGGGAGHLYVKDGELIHAMTGGEEGLEAAYRILAWEQAQSEFAFTCKVERTIELPLQQILMNMALRWDAQRQQEGEAGDERWRG